ncbi:hypothetical protein BLOT_016184 [Blomia tropicalis]|nr:hypothetical protein BLOT_016184 [Blomia tropicalis]
MNDRISPIIWAPPTPPQDENDLYIDYSLGFLYEKTLMPESQLPSVYTIKENKRLRLESGTSHGRKNSHQTANSAANSHSQHHTASNTSKNIRRIDELVQIPKSPFDRTNSTINRFRRDLLTMKIKLWPGNGKLTSSMQQTITNFGSSAIPSSNITSQQMLAKNNFNPNLYPRWLIHEDFSIIKVLLYIQDLPHNLGICFPGHLPNWEFVADNVNCFNSFKRSSISCKYHFESSIAAKDDQRIPMNDGENLPKTPLQNQMINTKQSKSNKRKNQQIQSVLCQQANPFLSPAQPGAINSPGIGTTSLVGPTGFPGKGSVNSSTTTNPTLLQAQPLSRISNILHNSVKDNNMEFTNDMVRRFSAIKQIVISKTQTSKSRFKKPQPKLFDHINLLLNDYKIVYHQPLSVEQVAANRAERIYKEKQAAREQQAREQSQRDTNQIKAIIQGTTSTPPNKFQSTNSIATCSQC